MELPFFTSSSGGGGGSGATRTEALRWLAIAEKLLAGRDLVGSKSFAVRARESDPNLFYADQIIAVADTLLAGDKRINNQHDWYAILQLGGHQTRDSELIASQYRELATLLNPQKNNVPYADHAFTLVLNAWSVLSNPSTKSMYDNEIMSQLEFNSLSHGSNPMVSGEQVNFHPFEINFQVMPQHQQQQGMVREQVTQPIPQYGMSQEQVTQHFPQQNVSREQVTQQNLTRGQVRQPKPIPPPPQPQPQLPTQPPQVQQKPQPQPQAGQPQQQRKEYWMGTNVTVTHNFPGVVENSNSNSNNNNNNNNDNVHVHVSGNTSNVAENVKNSDVREEERRMEEEASDDDGELSFWTACPYCYYMYEYPNVYAECALKCQNCKKAFQAVVIPDPPQIIDGHGQEAYFCCWGMMPLGVSMDTLEKYKGPGGNWTPFSPMFTCPQGFGKSGVTGNPNNVRGWNASNNVQGSRGGNVGGGRKRSGPRVYVDNEDVFVEVSGSSEEDDHDLHHGEASDKRKKTTKGAKRKASFTPMVAQEGVPISNPNLSYPHLLSQLF